MREQPVTGVSDARASLTALLRNFRTNPEAKPVLIGSHRRADAVMLSVVQYARLQQQDGQVPAGGVLEDLQERSFLVRRIAALNRIGSVAVFGSVARREETAGSDVDLMVVPGGDASLFDLAQFEEDMEMLVRRPVDVVSRRSLDPQRDQKILAEAVEL